MDNVQQRLAYERTHLANERTFAAWIRTGLSVAVVGIAINEFLPGAAGPSALSLTLGACFVVVGIGLMAFGAWRFVRTQRQLIESGTVPPAIRPAIIYLMSACLSALLLAILVIA